MLCLTSCATFCPKTEIPVEIKVPVPVSCPVPPTIDPIVDPVLSFTPETSVEQMVLDIRASRVLWRDRAIQLETILNGYRQPTTK